MTWEGVIYWLLNKIYVPTLHLHLLFSQQNVLTRYNRLTRDVIKGWEEEGKESLHLSMGNMYSTGTNLMTLQTTYKRLCLCVCRVPPCPVP